MTFAHQSVSLPFQHRAIAEQKPDFIHLIRAFCVSGAPIFQMSNVPEWVNRALDAPYDSTDADLDPVQSELDKLALEDFLKHAKDELDTDLN